MYSSYLVFSVSECFRSVLFVYHPRWTESSLCLDISSLFTISSSSSSITSSSSTTTNSLSSSSISSPIYYHSVLTPGMIPTQQPDSKQIIQCTQGGCATLLPCK